MLTVCECWRYECIWLSIPSLVTTTCECWRYECLCISIPSLVTTTSLLTASLVTGVSLTDSRTSHWLSWLSLAQLDLYSQLALSSSAGSLFTAHVLLTSTSLSSLTSSLPWV